MSTELLVPLDGSALADSAVAHAAEIARRTDASLHLIRVHTPFSLVAVSAEAPTLIPDPVIEEELRADAAAWLARRASAVSKLNDVAVTFELRTGLPEAEIVLTAAERRSHFIVCTTRGAGGGATRWLGSVVDGLIRHASCPVFAMSPAAVARDVRLGSVLVLLDGSEASGSIVPHAVWLAHAFEARLSYLRLMPAPTHPSKTILDYIERTQPDAIALSTHGRGLSRVVLGGVADDLVRASGRPVLVFKPRDLGWHKASGDRSLVSTVTHE